MPECVKVAVRVRGVRRVAQRAAWRGSAVRREERSKERIAAKAAVQWQV